jgi:hypothetical protein
MFASLRKACTAHACGQHQDCEESTMPYNGDQALAWVKNIIKPAVTNKYRQYAVLDLVGFMGIIDHFENDEWYKSYALLLFYNTLGKDKQNAMGMNYTTPLKFSYTNGTETKKANRDKDTKPTVDKNPALLVNKNVEIHGCGQCAYFAERAGHMLGIPQSDSSQRRRGPGQPRHRRPVVGRAGIPRR